MEAAGRIVTSLAIGAAALAIGGACALAVPQQAQAATPGKATITKVESTASTVTVYAKAKGAEFYQYRLCANKHFKKDVKKGSASTKHYKFKGLKKNKRYYVKVRAVADKTGKWSKAESVRTKKAKAAAKPVTLHFGGKAWGFRLAKVKLGGTSYARLTYKWKNTQKVDDSASSANIYMHAYQSGIRLDKGNCSNNMYAYVRPGKTLTVYQEFKLHNTKSKVQIIVEDDYSGNTLYNHKFTI